MPPRDWKQRVDDILEAISRIQRYTAGLTFEEFGADERTIDAVVRNMIVIGEAAWGIPAEIRQRHPEVPWTEMRGMRNVATHAYFAVILTIVWETIRRDLVPLASRLRDLLAAEG